MIDNNTIGLFGKKRDQLPIEFSPFRTRLYFRELEKVEYESDFVQKVGSNFNFHVYLFFSTNLDLRICETFLRLICVSKLKA